jgi:hypothetical protein
MPKSAKPIVIDRIYDQLFDPQTNSLSRRVVNTDDIDDAIRWAKAQHQVKLKGSNPFNFMKDIIRGEGGANMWPDRLKDLRIGGRQVTGQGNVFEFVDYVEGQTVPFPSRFGFHPGVDRFEIQSVSIPLAAKALGRNDETYLIQVAVKLGIIETHLALRSKLHILEVNHLQVGIKLRLTEVDSVYAATYEDDFGERKSLIVTVEAKKRGQRILEEQVEQQVREAFTAIDTELVVPLAMVVAEKGIYVIEFNAVHRAELAEFSALEWASDALYELNPPVPGINAPRNKRAKNRHPVAHG